MAQDLEREAIAKPGGFVRGHRVDHTRAQARVGRLAHCVQQLRHTLVAELVQQPRQSARHEILTTVAQHQATALGKKTRELLVVTRVDHEVILESRRYGRTGTLMTNP